MIKITQLTDTLRREIERLTPGQSITFATYKNDRGFTLRRTADAVTIDEFGYYTARIDAPDTKTALQHLRKIAKREFPRSHSVRIHRAEVQP